MFPIIPIARIKQWFKRRQARQATIRELSALPDYALNDLGISRQRIPEIVDEMLTLQAVQQTAGPGRDQTGQPTDVAARDPCCDSRTDMAGN